MKEKSRLCRFTRIGKSLRVALLLIIVGLLGAFPYSASAQEPVTAQFQTQAGAYTIDVTTDPSSISAGTVRFTVGLSGIDTHEPITDAQVVINAVRDKDGLRGWATAIHQVSSPGSYEARLELKAHGVWRTSVDISSPRGRVEVESPAVTIPEPRWSKSGRMLIFEAFVVILVGTAYVIWSRRRAVRAEKARNSG